MIMGLPPPSTLRLDRLSAGLVDEPAPSLVQAALRVCANTWQPTAFFGEVTP
jgi:hypothetical protein